MPYEDKDAIERLKKELYSREVPTVGDDIRSPLSQEENAIPHAWPEPEASVEEPMRPPLAQFSDEPKKGLSFAVKFLIISVIFFIVAAGATAYWFLGGANTVSAQNIDIQVIAPSLINGGKEQTVQVIISNKNKTALTLADLIVDYPDGTRSGADPTQILQHDRQIIGTIGSGAQIKKTLDALFYGQQGAQQTVTVTLEYSVPGSNAIFQKKAQVAFTIGSSPVSVSVQTPSEAIANQQFDMNVTLQANGTSPVQDVMFEAQYPFGFTLVSADPAAGSGGAIWRLGTFAPGEAKTIHIRGFLAGQDGDERIFHLLAGSDANPTDVHVAVPFLSVPAAVTVRKPFIDAALVLNAQGSTVSVAPGSTVEGVITWENNLTIPVTNLALQLAITGPALDRNSVVASTGFYQSSNSTIVWNSQQDADLAQIPPGGTGNLPFSFATLGSDVTGSYANPTIMLNLTLNATRNGETGVPESVSSAATGRVSIASLVTVRAQALHFTGPFSNSGPIPPVSGQKTSYTIQWTVTNSSNSLANGVVSATLPPYVDFVTAQSNSGITYDAPSRTVTWNIGNITASAGYTRPSAKAAFQVVLLPSLSQVGQTPSLTSQATLTADDRFAQVPIQASADGPTTELTGDTGYQDGMQVVHQGK